MVDSHPSTGGNIMELLRYVLVFILGGSLGVLFGCIFASGGDRERSAELARVCKVAKTPMNQSLRTGTNGKKYSSTYNFIEKTN